MGRAQPHPKPDLKSPNPGGFFWAFILKRQFKIRPKNGMENAFSYMLTLQMLKRLQSAEYSMFKKPGPTRSLKGSGPACPKTDNCRPRTSLISIGFEKKSLHRYFKNCEWNNFHLIVFEKSSSSIHSFLNYL